MAITYIQTATSVDGSNIPSYIWNNFNAGAIGSGHAVVGCVSFDSGVNLTNITDDKGNTYNTGTPFTQNGFKCVPFWLGNITNGPVTLTTNLSGNGTFHRGVCAEYSGAAALSDPTDGYHGQGQTTPGLGTDAVSSGALVTTVNGDMLWAGTMGLSFQAQPNSGTGWTNRADGGSGSGIWNEDKTQVSAGSITATFTATQDGDTGTFIIALKLPSTTQQGNALLAGTVVLTANATIPGILVGDYVLDNGLNSMASVCNKIYVGSSQATTYTEATSTFALGNFDYGSPIAFGAAAAGSPNGRKITSVAISNGSVTASGGVSWWAAVDSANSRFLASGPVLAPASIATGQIFTLGAFSIHIPSN